VQNHDQVGNQPRGRRLSHAVDLESYKAACALLMLSPCTPLIFMGDEFAASTPFLYFTDHETALAALVTAGRAEEFREFWQSGGGMPDPQDESTFQLSKLSHEERDRRPQAGVLRLFRELLRIRRADAVLHAWDRWRMLTEAVGDAAVAIERWDDEGRRRLLIVNFGDAMEIDVGEQRWMGQARELLWRAVLCSAEERFSGPGVDLADVALQPGEPVSLPGRSAIRWLSEA
jgi:maltooligosyltrehalose trehalohydrolase